MANIILEIVSLPEKIPPVHCTQHEPRDPHEDVCGAHAAVEHEERVVDHGQVAARAFHLDVHVGLERSASTALDVDDEEVLAGAREHVVGRG